MASREVFGPSQGAAVLDIGGDIGAAVVHTTAALEGEEIEITPDGCEWDGTHVAVRRRTNPGPVLEPIFCAVFSHLRAGVYRIRVRNNRCDPSQLLTVEGAQVVHLNFTSSPPRSWSPPILVTLGRYDVPK
jgi:hypothetical protein